MPFIAWLTKCIGSWVQFIRISEREDGRPEFGKFLTNVMISE